MLISEQVAAVSFFTSRSFACVRKNSTTVLFLLLWFIHVTKIPSIWWDLKAKYNLILTHGIESSSDKVHVSLPPAMKLGQGYVFTGICDSVHRGGVPDQVHPLGPGTPPRTRYPPDQVPPWDQVPPGPGSAPLGPGTPPGDQVPPTPGTPPWDQVHPPGTEHAGRYSQRVGSTHPTGMQSFFVCLVLDKQCLLSNLPIASFYQFGV